MIKKFKYFYLNLITIICIFIFFIIFLFLELTGEQKNFLFSLPVILMLFTIWLMWKIYCDGQIEQKRQEEDRQQSILIGLKESIDLIKNNIDGHRKDISRWHNSLNQSSNFTFPSYSITNIDSNFLISHIAQKIRGKSTLELKKKIIRCQEKIEDINNQSHREIMNLILRSSISHLNNSIPRATSHYIPITDIGQLHYHIDLMNRLYELEIELAKLDC